MKWPRILPAAYEDARDAIESIARTNPRRALEFTDVLANAFEEIESHPRQFARLETNRTEQEIRRVVLRRFNYLVISKW